MAEIPESVREAIARAMYECEADRACHCDAVLSAASGKHIKPTMEPWEEVASIYRGDADSVVAELRILPDRLAPLGHDEDGPASPRVRRAGPFGAWGEGRADGSR